MVRSKVKLEFIQNETARKATFKKRKKCILKKIDELTILCDIEACAIICSPYDDEPIIWPNPTGARRVLSRLHNLPEEYQEKKMLDQEAYLKQRVAKASNQLEKHKKDATEKELTNFMYDILNGFKSLDDLDLKETKDLYAIARKTLGHVGELMDQHVLDNEASTSSSSLS